MDHTYGFDAIEKTRWQIRTIKRRLGTYLVRSITYKVQETYPDARALWVKKHEDGTYRVQALFGVSHRYLCTVEDGGIATWTSQNLDYEVDLLVRTQHPRVRKAGQEDADMYSIHLLVDKTTKE